MLSCFELSLYLRLQGAVEAVGVDLFIFEELAVGDALATLEKSSDPDGLERCAAELLKAFTISASAPERAGLILERV